MCQTIFQVLTERLESSQKTCQSLQSYIASLFSKLEESRTQSSSTSASTIHSSSCSQVSWDSHSCGDRCRRSASYAGLEILNDHRAHERSHRHSMNTPRDTENPFRSRSQASSISSVSESLRRSTNHDSGIERSSDVISQVSNDVTSH